MMCHSYTLFSRSLVVTFLICAAFTTTAQELFEKKRYRYAGFEANFGVKSAKISSNIPQIHGMDVKQEGGSLGFVVGNVWLKTRLQVAGFYYSNSSVPQTVNLLESALVVNIYPINLITRQFCALNPYVGFGGDYSSYKFFGYYAQDNVQYNYSSSSAPYVGRTMITRGGVAAGLEWRLNRESDFIHIFGEYRCSVNAARDADAPFENTKIGNGGTVNLGVSFGFLK